MPNLQNILAPVLIVGPGRTASSYVISHLHHSAGVFQELIENDVYRVMYRCFRQSWWSKDWHWVTKDDAEVERRVLSAIRLTLVELFPSDQPRWAMKMIWDEHDPDIVDRLFPEARYLHLVRDPRTNIASVVDRLGWSREKAERLFVASNETALEFERFRGRYLRTRQEDFLIDRAGTWRSLCEFLDTPYREGPNWAAEVNVAESQKGKVGQARTDNRLEWKDLPSPVQKMGLRFGYGPD